MNKKNSLNPKTITKLLTALVLVSLPLSSITKISKGDQDIPEYNLFKGSTVSISLGDYFDLSEVKYDSAKFEVTSGGGKTLTFNVPAYHNNEELIVAPKFVELINKDTFLVAEGNSDLVTVVRCTIDSLQSKLDCSKSSQFGPKKDDLPSGTYKTDAVAFDSTNKQFFVAWRTPDDAILVIGSYKLDDGSLIRQVNFPMGDGKLVNRVRLEVLETPDFDPTKAPQIELIAFDQNTKNGKDDTVSLNMVSFLLDDDKVIQDGKARRFQEKSEDILAPDSITTYYEFDGQFFVSGIRKDQDELICLTRLTFDDNNEFINLEKDAFYCEKDLKNGFLGFGQGNQIFIYNSDTKTFKKKYITWPSTSQIPTVKDADYFELDQSVFSGKGGIREIHEGQNNYIIRLAQDVGVDDSGTNSIIVANDELKVQFNAKEKSVNSLVNSFNFEFTQGRINTYILKGAFYVLSTDEPESAHVSIGIKASDADTPDGITVTGNWYIINDPFDTVDVSSYVHPPIEIYPGGYSRFIFPYSTVTKGNDLTFKLNFAGDDFTKNLNQQTLLYQEHTLNMPDFDLNDKSLNIVEFEFMTGAAALQNGTKLFWFLCGDENEFSTQCFNLDITNTYGMNMQKRIDGALQIIYSWTYKPKASAEDSEFSYFNWYEFGLDGGKGAWQYEHYDGRILDIGHVRTQGGNVYTIVAFEKKVMVSLFFDNWSYGNRKPVVFMKEDVNDKDLCPQQIVFNPKKRNVFYVYSNCDNEQQLLEFAIDNTNGEVSYIYSHFIGNSDKNPEICVLENEIVLYEPGTKQVTSIDDVFSLTRISIDYSKYNVNGIEDFACFPEQNEFYILNKVRNPKGDEYSEVVVFNGGTHKDAYKRIRVRLSNLPINLEKVQPFYHRGQVVLALFDGNSIPIFKRFDDSTPAVSATCNNVESTDQEIDYTMVVRSNGGSGAKLVKGQLRVLKGMDMVAPTLRKDKEDTEKDKSYQVNYLLDLSKTQIFEATLISDDQSAKPGDYFSLSSNKRTAISYEQGKNTVGKWLELEKSEQEKFYLMASYSKSSRLKYGGIKMYKKDDQSSKELSAFYGYNAFNSVSAVQVAGKYTLIAMVTNEGQYNGLQVTIAIDGKLSSIATDIDAINDLSTVDIFAVNSDSENPGTYEAVLVGYSQRTQSFSVYHVEFDIGAPGNQVPEDPDKWTATFKGSPITSERNIGSFSIVNEIAANTLNVYYKKTSDAKLYFNTYDMKAKKFTTPQLFKLEAGDKLDAEVAKISCSRFKLIPSVPDQCAFSTYGAIAYYASILIKDGAATVTAKRLRKDGDYYGTNISANDRFVILETERTGIKQDKKLIVWDITDYSKQLSQVPGAGDIPVFTLVDMRGDSVDNYNDSKFLGSFVETGEFSNYKVFLFIQNEFSDQTVDQYSVIIDKRELTPWILTTVKVPGNQADFDKLKISFTSANGKKADVALNTFLNYKTQVSEKEQQGE